MRQKWTENDISFIKENYPKFGGAFCAEKLKKSRIAINQKTCRLKLKRNFNSIKIPEGNKFCCSCQSIKTLNHFYQKKKGLANKCKNCSSSSYKLWRKGKKDRLKKYGIKWRKENKKRCLEYKREYISRPYVKVVKNLRNRISEMINKKSKSINSMNLLGCDAENLVKYLESKFHKGMTWDNYGIKGWHIDHIRPCASFDLTNPKQQRECFNYLNLQPLWAFDNLSKGNNLVK